MSYGGTLTNVYVATSRDLSYAVSVEGVVIDRVIAEASGTANGAIELRPNPAGVVLRNSVARAAAGQHERRDPGQGQRQDRQRHRHRRHRA